MDNTTRGQLDLGVVVHEMIHAYLNILGCFCDKCHLNSVLHHPRIGGHGVAFLAIAQKIDKIMQDKLQLYIPIDGYSSMKADLRKLRQPIDQYIRALDNYIDRRLPMTPTGLAQRHSLCIDAVEEQSIREWYFEFIQKIFTSIKRLLRQKERFLMDRATGMQTPNNSATCEHSEESTPASRTELCQAMGTIRGVVGLPLEKTREAREISGISPSERHSAPTNDVDALESQLSSPSLGKQGREDDEAYVELGRLGKTARLDM